MCGGSPADLRVMGMLPMLEDGAPSVLSRGVWNGDPPDLRPERPRDISWGETP